jgi:hypothetical protein
MSGVEQSEEMLKWIWENFSAVAGDHPTFECWRMSYLLHQPFSHSHLETSLGFDYDFYLRQSLTYS